MLSAEASWIPPCVAAQLRMDARFMILKLGRLPMAPTLPVAMGRASGTSRGAARQNATSAWLAGEGLADVLPQRISSLAPHMRDHDRVTHPPDWPARRTTAYVDATAHVEKSNKGDSVRSRLVASACAAHSHHALAAMVSIGRDFGRGDWHHCSEP
jgi:hypothetical protein